ncbi:lipocalin family protein [Flavobacterium sp.]|uniref:lipocalin family protein n=1 Tax=Flavobacterium sp. TaxID=239 RepID=UPI00333F84EB
MMKKIFYLLSFTFLLLQACSSSGSSDGSSSSTSGSLVGKWELFQVASFPPGTIITDSTPLINYQFDCPTLKDYCQFGSQGSLKQVSYNSSCAETNDIGTYTKTDNLINLYKNNVYKGYWEILSLTSSTLKIKYPTPQTGTPYVIVVVS